MTELSTRTECHSRSGIAAAAALAVLILILYIDDWARLIRRWWSDPNYTHGFFVVLISAVLVWAKRRELRLAKLRPSWVGLPVLLFGIGVKLWTLVLPSRFVACVSMLFVISGVVLFTAGRQAFWRTAVPILLLFFMIPLPPALYHAIELPWRRASAIATTNALQGLGLPVVRERTILHLPFASLAIGGQEMGCPPGGPLDLFTGSGMPIATKCVALCLAFAYLCRRPAWERIVFVLSSVPIAFLANVLRLAVAVAAIHGSLSLEPRGPHGSYALELWAFILAAFCAEYYVLSSRLFAHKGAHDGASVVHTTEASQVAQRALPGKIRRRVVVCAAIIALAVVTHRIVLEGLLEVIMQGNAAARTPLALPLEQLPMQLNGWTGTDTPQSDEVVALSGADAWLRRDYILPSEGRVLLYMAHYGNVQDNVPHGPVIPPYPALGWATKMDGIVTFPSTAPRFEELKVQELLYERGSSQVAVLNWYVVDGEQLAELPRRTAVPRLLHSRAAYLFHVLVSTPVVTSHDRAFALLERFWQENFEAIAKHLPRPD